MAAHDKIYRYWIAVPSGLEAVALDDLREYAPEVQQVEVEPGGRVGRIFFTYKRSPERLLQLRSAVQCAGLISQMHGVTVGPPGLDYICKRIARCDLTPVKSLARATSAPVDPGAFALSATLQGRYRFSAAELIAAVAAVLRDEHGLRRGKGPHLLRFHLQLTGRRALLGLRLGPGVAPKAAVAYCLARLVAMQPGACVLWARRDPGELAALREAFAPSLLVGIRANLSAALDQLPLVGGCLDYAFTLAGANPAAELAELARVLRAGGIAVVQVADFASFIAPLEAEDYPLEVLADLELPERGRTYRLVVLERLAEEEAGLLQVL